MPEVVWKLLELVDAHPVASLGVGLFVLLYAELMFCGPKAF